MDSQTFLILFAALGCLSFLIGLYASKSINSQIDYYLSGRKLPVMPLTLTLVATQIGGGVILGTADEAYKFGIYGLTYSIGISLGFIFLACGFASKLRGFNIVTTAQLFETHYQSTFLRKLSSILIVLSMSGILVGQVIASRRLLLGLGIDGNWILIAFWAFVILYTVIGGLKAVVLTDVYQVLFIIILFIGLLIYSQFQYPVTSINWLPFETSEFELSYLLGFLLLPLLFCIVEQDLAQRCFSAKTKWVATIATALAAIILLLFSIIPVYFGTLANQLGITPDSGASTLVVLLSTITNKYMIAVVAIALLAAIISTADSLLCAISSNLAQDFGLKLSDKQGVTFARIITLFIGIFALALANYFDDILHILAQSYELPVSALFVSILFCCISKRLHKLAAGCSVLVGIISFLLFKFLPINFPQAILQLLLSLIAYLVGWTWAEILEKRSPMKCLG